jgi:hypothetical protein
MKSRRPVAHNELFNKRWLGYAMGGAIEQTETETYAGSTGKQTKKRRTLPLPEKSAKRLAAYLMAAGAGATLAASAAPANASIIYTPANLSFGADSSLSFSLSPNSLNVFNLNNHTSTLVLSGVHYLKSGHLFIGGAGNGSSVVIGRTWVRQLQRGAYIGPKLGTNNGWSGGELLGKWRRSRFSSGGGIDYSGTNTGSWPDGGKGFVGLRFLINGQEHYGWAAFVVGFHTRRTGYFGRLTEYAYDTVPNQGLDAGQTASTPEPGTLGLLALGSLGLGLWRRKAEHSVNTRNNKP